MNRIKSLFVVVCVLLGIARNSNAQPVSLFPESYTTPSLVNFSMVVCSDPQWYFSRKNVETTYTADQIKKLSTERLQNSVHTINGLYNMSGARLNGVIINGDLTRLGSENQLTEFKSIYGNLQPILYPGLGNHDYQNNLTKENEPENAARMVDYLIESIQKLNIPERYGNLNSGNIGETSFHYRRLGNTIMGSLSYSWEIGNIHFIQLHNYPLYNATWKANDINYYIQSSGFYMEMENFLPKKFTLGWLGADIEQATQRGMQIILNFHQWGDSEFPVTEWGVKNLPKSEQMIWTAENIKKMTGIMEKFLNNSSVIAIFTGHLHEDFGYSSLVGRQREDQQVIPVFRSGAVFYDNYFMLEFYDDEMFVLKGNSKDGGYNIDRTNIVKIKYKQ